MDEFTDFEKKPFMGRDGKYYDSVEALTRAEVAFDIQRYEKLRQFRHNYPTPAEKLQKEGFRKVAEFNCGDAFPAVVLPNADLKGSLDTRLGVDVRIVDKAELNPDYKPGRVYVVYKK